MSYSTILFPILEVTLVVDMLGLARRTFDGARRQDMDVGLDAHHAYDAIV